MHGHLAARLDPLGSEPMGDPALDESRLIPPLTPELQARIPSSAPPRPRRRPTPARGAARAARGLLRHDRLRDRAHLRPRRARLAPAGDRVGPLPAAARRRSERHALLARLAQAEGFEQYLRRAFLGQKQFSLEGLDAMMPMLDEAIELAAAAGAHEVVIGMAHRGRLNVLAHTVGRPYESILREFEGERTIDAIVVGRRGRHRRRQVPPAGDRHPRHGERRGRRSRWLRTRATSRPSTPWSRAGRGPSRPTAPPAPGSTTRPSRCRS